ncbi:MAG: methyltransferase [Candidatus Aenigmarchaeota archaeon]|nr:methyltransferase [Candidatus Aenigmarchaeota archaeon]
MIIMIPSSYDILGSREKAIAIIEDMENPKEAAEHIMKEHKNVESVLMKLSERKGLQRKREYKLIIGNPDTEVIHKENYCRLKLDPRKTYFSGRESTERLRIAEKIEGGETVLVMFAGIGPFSILIAKKQPEVERIPSIEINPEAVKYMKENIKLNKVEGKVIPILGDVNEKSPDWFDQCDRIIMPLPHKAKDYLGLTGKCLKSDGGVIHLYIIESEENVEGETKNLIGNFQEKTAYKINYKIHKVLPYAPGVYKYCVDIQAK